MTTPEPADAVAMMRAKLIEVRGYFHGALYDKMEEAISLLDKLRGGLDERGSGKAWQPIADLKPDDGFVLLSPVDDDGEIPEVWSAEQYHLAMSPDRTPAFVALHEAAKLVTHFMRLPEAPR